MKNWKTTVAGLLTAALMIFAQSVQNRITDPTAPPITSGNVLPAIGVAMIGVLARDASNNSGGPGPTGTNTDSQSQNVGGLIDALRSRTTDSAMVV